MGIEVEWESPIPDGHTVPYQVEAAQAESVTVWRSGQRRARLVLRLHQAAWWAVCVLVPTLIVISAVRHG